VILCRRGNAEAALHRLREIMGKLKLTVNEDKTQICKVPEGEFDFLGFTFGRMYSPTTGAGPPWLCDRQRRASSAWSKPSPRADCPPAAYLARDHRARRQVEPRAPRGGPITSSVGSTSKAYRALDTYVAVRLRRWFAVSSTRAGDASAGSYPLSHLYGYFGLVRLTQLGRGPVVGEGREVLVRERSAGNPPAAVR